MANVSFFITQLKLNDSVPLYESVKGRKRRNYVILQNTKLGLELEIHNYFMFLTIHEQWQVIWLPQESPSIEYTKQFIRVLLATLEAHPKTLNLLTTV